MTQSREVLGMRSDGKHSVMTTLTLRATRDNNGQTISIADEKRGIMLVIPVEPVADILEVK